MSDDVLKTIITSLATAAPLMLMYWLNHKAVLSKLGEVDQKVQTIEKQTNSMQEALVLGAKKAGVSEEREKQAEIAKAVIAATSQPVAAPAPAGKGNPGKLGDAIEALTEAAEETVVSAEKTVEHAEKIPKK